MMPLRISLCLASLLLVSAARAQTPAMPPAPTAVTAKKPAKSEPSGWVFSILPKSFQKNPNIDLTVITEMTELGKKQPVASPGEPVYYLAQSSGYHPLGHAPGNEHTLKPEDIERLLGRALATNGFLPAAPPAHPATLVILYTWGSHSMLVEMAEPEILTKRAVPEGQVEIGTATVVDDSAAKPMEKKPRKP